MANCNKHLKSHDENQTLLYNTNNKENILIFEGHCDNISSLNYKQTGIQEDCDKVVCKIETEDTKLQIKNGELLPSLKTSDSEKVEYNPYEHRNVENPTNDVEALIHMLKGSLGSGILAIPLAFQTGGLWFSLVSTFIVGYIVTYCSGVFVHCGQIICRRRKLPSVTFRQIGELSFIEGPQCLRKFSKLAGLLVDVSLVTENIGCCSAYIILVSRNLQQVIEFYTKYSLDLRYYMAGLLPIYICLNFITNLKRLTPISMIANVLFISGIGISFYYITQDLPPISQVPAFSSWDKLPTFFGTVIFALEGIGVVVPIENNMKKPQNFLGCPGILNIGMSIVIVLYAITGFFGYWKYGENTKANITVNLPTDKLLGQVLKIIIAIAVFFTYCLLFYVASSIMFGDPNRNLKKNPVTYFAKRIGFILLTFTISALFPNLGPMLTLVGALCLSTVGLILPPIFEMLLFSSSPGFGKFNWRLWKNIAILLFGIVGLISGTMVGVKEMVNSFAVVKD